MSYQIKYCDIPYKALDKLCEYVCSIQYQFPLLLLWEIRSLVLKQFNCTREIDKEDIIYYIFDSYADYIMFLLRFS